MSKVRGKDENNFDVLVKLIIIGDSGVGKTNILMRFCDSQFKENYVATIGVDFKIKTINVEDKRIKLQIWDTAGQQRFKNITQTYYKGAVGIILAYSVTDEVSFDNIEKWINQINENTQASVKKILIGNKCDLRQERKVSQEAGKRLASMHDMPFLQVSARDGTNIEEIFALLGRQIKKQLDDQSIPSYIKKTSLKKAEQQHTKKRCC